MGSLLKSHLAVRLLSNIENCIPSHASHCSLRPKRGSGRGTAPPEKVAAVTQCRLSSTSQACIRKSGSGYATFCLPTADLAVLDDGSPSSSCCSFAAACTPSFRIRILLLHLSISRLTSAGRRLPLFILLHLRGRVLVLQLLERLLALLGRSVNDLFLDAEDPGLTERS